MNNSSQGKKITTFLVAGTFLSLVILQGLPARTASDKARAGNPAVSGAGGPGWLEKAAPEPGKRQKSWKTRVLVVAGFVGATVLAILLSGGKSDAAADSDALHEDFEKGADAAWKPRTAAKWSVDNGAYRCSAAMAANAKAYWEWSVYDRAWATADFTVSARMKVSQAKAGYGLMFSDTADMNNANVYQFFFLGDGRYKVRKIIGYDLFNAHNSGAITNFRDWTAAGAKAVAWNDFTVSKTGGSYALAVNGNSLFTFSDSAFDPRYVSLIAFTQLAAVQLEVDSLAIDPAK